jgi:hypothetical protein
VALLLAGLANLLLVAAAGLAGIAAFDAYPRVAMDLDPPTVLLAVAVLAIAIAPLLPDHLRRRRMLRG